MDDLEKALCDLKNNKSRDNDGLINELFKLEVIGEDLKKSLLVMFLKLKKKQMIPTFLNITNIRPGGMGGPKKFLIVYPPKIR